MNREELARAALVRMNQGAGLAGQQTDDDSHGEFVKGLLRGIDQTQGLLYGTAGLAGEAMGSTPLKRWGLKGYLRNQREAAENPAAVNDLRDIGSGGDFVDWFSGKLGELAPSAVEIIAASLAGGGVGGILGRQGIKTGLKKALGEAFEEGLSKGLTKELAEEFAKKAVVNQVKSIGTKAGIFAGSSALEIGGMAGDDFDQTGDISNPIGDLGFGLASGAVELIGAELPIVNKFLGSGTAHAAEKALEEGNKKLLRHYGQEVLKTALEEGSEESIQQILSVANSMNNTGRALTKDDLWQVVNAGAAGAAGAPVFGGLSVAGDRMEAGRAQTQADKIGAVNEAKARALLDSQLLPEVERKNAAKEFIRSRVPDADETTVDLHTPMVMDVLEKESQVSEMENRLAALNEEANAARTPQEARRVFDEAYQLEADLTHAKADLAQSKLNIDNTLPVETEPVVAKATGLPRGENAAGQRTMQWAQSQLNERAKAERESFENDPTTTAWHDAQARQAQDFAAKLQGGEQEATAVVASMLHAAQQNPDAFVRGFRELSDEDQVALMEVMPPDIRGVLNDARAQWKAPQKEGVSEPKAQQPARKSDPEFDRQISKQEMEFWARMAGFDDVSLAAQSEDFVSRVKKSRELAKRKLVELAKSDPAAAAQQLNNTPDVLRTQILLAMPHESREAVLHSAREQALNERGMEEARQAHEDSRQVQPNAEAVARDEASLYSDWKNDGPMVSPQAAQLRSGLKSDEHETARYWQAREQQSQQAKADIEQRISALDERIKSPIVSETEKADLRTQRRELSNELAALDDGDVAEFRESMDAPREPAKAPQPKKAQEPEAEKPQESAKTAPESSEAPKPESKPAPKKKKAPAPKEAETEKATTKGSSDEEPVSKKVKGEPRHIVTYKGHTFTMERTTGENAGWYGEPASTDTHFWAKTRHFSDFLGENKAQALRRIKGVVDRNEIDSHWEKRERTGGPDKPKPTAKKAAPKKAESSPEEIIADAKRGALLKLHQLRRAYWNAQEKGNAEAEDRLFGKLVKQYDMLYPKKAGESRKRTDSFKEFLKRPKSKAPAKFSTTDKGGVSEEPDLNEVTPGDTASSQEDSVASDEKVNLSRVRQAFGGHEVVSHAGGRAAIVRLPHGRRVIVLPDSYIVQDVADIKGGRRHSGQYESSADLEARFPGAKLDGVALVRLNEYAEDSTIDHEHFHAAVSMALSSLDQKALEREFGPLDDIANEEKAAVAYEEWKKAGGAPTPKVKGIFNKLFNRIGQLFWGLNKSRSYKDVFKSMEDGSIWSNFQRPQHESGRFSTVQLKHTVEPQVVTHYGPEGLDALDAQEASKAHNTFSEGHMGTRKARANETHPFHPVFFAYGPGVEPESQVGTKGKANSFKTPRNTYDMVSDKLGIADWAKGVADKWNDTHDPDDLVHWENIAGKRLSDMGYDGFAYDSGNGEWFQFFGRVDDFSPSGKQVMAVAPVVESRAKVEGDLDTASHIGETILADFKERVRSIAKDYKDLQIVEGENSLYQGDAAQGNVEFSANFTVKGTKPSIRAFAAEALIAHSQNLAFIEGDSENGETNGTRVKYRVKPEYSLQDIKSVLDKHGVSEFNITKSGGENYIDTFIPSEEDGSHKAAIAAIVDAAGELRDMKGGPLVEDERLSEMVGTWDDDPGTSREAAKKVLTDYWGKTKGNLRHQKLSNLGDKYADEWPQKLAEAQQGPLVERVSEEEAGRGRDSASEGRAGRVRDDGDNSAEGAEAPQKDEVAPGKFSTRELASVVPVSTLVEEMDRNTDAALNFKSVWSKLREGGEYYERTQYPISDIDFDEDYFYGVDPSKADPSKGTIIIGKDGFVIDGRHRVLKAKQDGAETVTAYAPTNRKFSTTVIRSRFDGDEQAQTVLDKFGIPRDKHIKERAKEHVEGLVKNWRTKVFDRFHPFHEMERRHGVEDDFQNSPYVALRMMTSMPEILSSVFQNGVPTWRGGKVHVETEGQGIFNVLKSLGDDADLFLVDMARRRAEKLMAEGRENLFSQADLDKAKQMVESSRTMPEEVWKQAERDYLAFKKGILKFAIDSGVLTQEAVDAWDHAEYIPFYRVTDDDAKTISPHSKKDVIDAGIRKLKGGTGKLGDPLENLVKNYSHLMEQSMRNQAQVKALLLMKKDNMAEWRGKRDADKHFVTVMVKGERAHYEVYDPELYHILTNIDTKGFEQFAGMSFMRWTKRTLTQGATFGPAFRVANFLRDMIHTSMIEPEHFTPLDSFKGFVKAWKDDKHMKALRSGGGSFDSGYINAADPTAVARYLRGATKRGSDNPASYALKPLKHLWELWEKVGNAAENAARVQLYTNLIADGKSEVEAAYKAKDLMDFSMAGSSGTMQFLIQIVPFLGARAAGLYKIGREMGPEGKHRMSVLKKGAFLALATAGLWAMNHNDERWKELENYDKFLYYHILLPDGFKDVIGTSHIRIPKPFELGALFSGSVESMLDGTVGDDKLGHVGDFIGFTATQTFAIGLPQVITPWMQQWANKNNFTGRPIVGYSMQKLAGPEQYHPWTSPFLRELAKAMPEWLPEEMRSPKRAEQFINDTTSTIGGLALSILDWGTKQMVEGYPDGPSMTIDDYVGIGRFARPAIPKNTKYVGKFYEALREAEKAVATLKSYRKVGNMEDAQAWKNEYAKQIGAKKSLSKIQQRLSRLNKKMKLVWRQNGLTPEQKRKQVDQLIETRNKIVWSAYNRFMANW